MEVASRLKKAVNAGNLDEVKTLIEVTGVSPRVQNEVSSYI